MLLSAGDIPLECIGRHYFDSNESLYSHWPGMRIRFAIKAAKVTIILSAQGVYFDIYINNKKRSVAVNQSESASVYVNGQHRIALELENEALSVIELKQRSESQLSPVVLHAIEFNCGGHVLPLKCKKEAGLIEFIGDSFLVGYGNLYNGCQAHNLASPSAPLNVDILTNSQHSMAAYCALKLGYEWRLTALSGHGVIRNYAGSQVRNSFPYYFYKTTSKPQRTSNTADIVVVNLGCNDFSTPLGHGELFNSQADLITQFNASYRQLITRINNESPNAIIILLAIPHPDAPMQRICLHALQLALKEQCRIYYCQLPALSLSGYDAHPSLADHQLAGDYLAQFIAKVLSKL